MTVPPQEELGAKLQVHSIEIPDTRKADGSETGIFRSNLPFSPRRAEFQHLKTLYEGFEHTVKKYPNRPFLGHRPTVRDPVSGNVISQGYVWQTYKQVHERTRKFASGLLKAYDDFVVGAGGQGDASGWHLGIYAVNRPEWVISDLASITHKVITAPLYDTLGPDAAEFIINHAEVPIVVASLDKVSLLLKISSKCPQMKVIISMDNPGSPGTVSNNGFNILKQWATEKDVTLLSFADVEALGEKFPREPNPPSPDDVACLSYTSGTTGNPKGVMLTHKNITTMVIGMLDVGINVTCEDVHFSYLPLAHIYEKVLINAMVGVGASAGFYRGDVSLLLNDLETLRPTIFASVPRLLNRIHDGIKAKASVPTATALRAAIFAKALKTKLDAYDATGAIASPFWDALVFRKVRAALGGRIRIITSASAPISADVVKFLKIAFGCPVFEGYGQTESAGAATTTLSGDRDSGHVGGLMNCNEGKLVSVPDMGYFAKDNKGEIWVRGDNVFKGYYKDEEKTRETVTEDGWLKTGDIGSVDKKGRFTIIDRKKNLFKVGDF
ncbi:hypothetical protein HDU76_000995 [Blyttiomyces sp. JEL0837]|nr:hypothetical protein HDU76_000995 [Blyttiomyces sp. JEL0837]